MHGLNPSKQLKLSAGFETREVAVIAGFQGISDRGRITTLGRGGSNTSAVAVAAAQGPTVVISTPMLTAFTPRTRYGPKARKIPAISYDEMLRNGQLGRQGCFKHALSVWRASQG